MESGGRHARDRKSFEYPLLLAYLLRHKKIMKTLFLTILVVFAVSAQAQSIVGKWQLSEQKTCFEAGLAAETKESDTEKELTGAMGSTAAAGVARVMTLGEKGSGEEGVMSAGKKKASSKESFKYQVSGSEFQVLDKKSGIIKERWIIDELTETTLKLHDAKRECETKTYIKVK